MDRIKVGKIVNAVALKGEVKIYSYSDSSRRFEELTRLIAGEDRELQIENVRYQKNMAIVKFRGIDDRSAAEALKEQEVFITEDDLKELPEDTFYVRDLIGCAVLEYESGQEIGTVSDVIQNTAQDIYQVALKKGGHGLIPAVEQFIRSVDVDKKEIRVSLIPGLIDSGEEV